MIKRFLSSICIMLLSINNFFAIESDAQKNIPTESSVARQAQSLGNLTPSGSYNRLPRVKSNQSLKECETKTPTKKRGLPQSTSFLGSINSFEELADCETLTPKKRDAACFPCGTKTPDKRMDEYPSSPLVARSYSILKMQSSMNSSSTSLSVNSIKP